MKYVFAVIAILIVFSLYSFNKACGALKTEYNIPELSIPESNDLGDLATKRYQQFVNKCDVYRRNLDAFEYIDINMTEASMYQKERYGWGDVIELIMKFKNDSVGTWASKNNSWGHTCRFYLDISSGELMTRKDACTTICDMPISHDGKNSMILLQ